MRVVEISETIQEFQGKRYYLCGRYFQRKGKKLHRVVWEYHYGPIPDGYHVHHIDGDPRNNQIENLQLLPDREHIKYHMNLPEAKERARKHMEENVRPKAAEWHKSEEGRRWHSYHAKRVWSQLQPIKRTCEHCGKEYETKLNRKTDRFCSNKCKSAWRRKTGADGLPKNCAVCGKLFLACKFKKPETCSKSCASKLAWRKRRDAG
jgi:HNH endonuclease.